MANWEHYNKVTEFKKLSEYFFEYVLRLELGNEVLKEKVEKYKQNDKAKNPCLANLDFSVRTHNRVKAFFKKEASEITLFDIYNCDFKELSKTRGFGRISAIEIEVAFLRYGLPPKP